MNKLKMLVKLMLITVGQYLINGIFFFVAAVIINAQWWKHAVYRPAIFFAQFFLKSYKSNDTQKQKACMVSVTVIDLRRYEYLG